MEEWGLLVPDCGRVCEEETVTRRTLFLKKLGWERNGREEVGRVEWRGGEGFARGADLSLSVGPGEAASPCRDNLGI